jgi:hypothetical protein
MFDLFSQGANFNWWEPGTPGVFDVGDLGAIFAFTLAVVGAAMGLSRWWMKQLKKVIHDEVEEFTQPIQPTANGGLSLPDVARKVEKLDSTIENVKINLKEDTERLEKSIDELKSENRETWGLLIKHLMKNDKDT